jgi:3D-(3,5/4)-trihydroxycyclohexane-1,2-dione acylhydrolase (decyclizing)
VVCATPAPTTRWRTSRLVVGIPSAETAAGEATVLASHPDAIGTVGIMGAASANKVAEEADLVLAVGTRLQDFTTGSWSLFRDPGGLASSS